MVSYVSRERCIIVLSINENHSKSKPSGRVLGKSWSGLDIFPFSEVPRL